MEKSIIRYQLCPLCGSDQLNDCLTATDFTVTKEKFEIWECPVCTVRFTQDVPGDDNIGLYYQSENYISHTDTRKGLINRLYHFIRKRTLAKKYTLICNEVGISNGTLLDIGAGTGAFAHYMQSRSWKVVGLEPDEKARTQALNVHNIELQPADQLSNLPPGSFDAITLWHVLEHVHDLHGYIVQLKKLLAPGGLLFIAVPNYTSFDAYYYKEFWAAYDVPRHLYHFSPVSMKKLLETDGFVHKHNRPMWFDSFYISLLSEKYKSGKTNLIASFIIGLRSNWKTIFDNEKCSSLIYIAGT